MQIRSRDFFIFFKFFIYSFTDITYYYRVYKLLQQPPHPALLHPKHFFNFHTPHFHPSYLPPSRPPPLPSHNKTNKQRKKKEERHKEIM